MVKFYLISGFLGSGKTTLLKNILKDWGSNRKIAIIQNEFASTGVDGKELNNASDNFKLVEINNGSVFCVCQLSNFIETIHQIMETYEPEIIFLESSGLADPISISELLMHQSFKSKIHLEKIITIVDARNFTRGLNLMPRYKHQLMVADTILLNKVDLYDEDLSIIKSSIGKIAPFAGIVESKYCKVDLNTLLKPLEEKPNCSIYEGSKSSGKPTEVQAIVLRTSDKIEYSKLQEFVQFLKEDCIRSKGFVNVTGKSQPTLFHQVYDDIKYSDATGYVGLTEIITFTSSLTLADIKQKFKSLTK